MDSLIDLFVFEMWSRGGRGGSSSQHLAGASGTFLVYGPRGCGKTFVAGEFFAAAGSHPISVDSADVLKKPDAKLENVFRAARRVSAPGLLIEDVDLLLGNLRRWPAAHRFLLDRIKQPEEDLTIFCTAMRPETLLPAELDAFRYVLPVFYGDLYFRRSVMAAHVRAIPLDADVDLHELGTLTEWWSAAELRDLMVQSPRVEKGPHRLLMQPVLLQQLDTIGRNIPIDVRRRRMGELLKFTAERCTSNIIREWIADQYGPDFIVRADSVPTINIGEVHVTQKQQINIKQAGVVVGSGGRAENFNVDQRLDESAAPLDVQQLARELAVLVRALHADHAARDHAPAIEAVSSAQDEAERGNAARTLAYLGKAGQWVFDVATKIGVQVAAEAIKKSTGLGR